MTEEKIYYQDENVLVSDKKVVIEFVTYAIEDITTVKKVEKLPNPLGYFAKALAIIGIILGIILAILDIIIEISIFAFVVCMFFFGAAFLLLYFVKPNFIVFIGGEFGDSNAFSSKNETYIDTIVKAIRSALIHYRISIPNNE